MTYEMKDFQEDEKRLRKQAKDGEISEEEFFLALKKLHNRATEGDSHLVQLARSIGISEDELFSGEYGDNYDDILKNILDKAGITESIHVPHTGDSDCTNPNCVGAKAEDIIFNNFTVPREGGMQCNHCDKHFEEEPEPTLNSAQVLNQPIVHDLLHHAKTHGKESKATEVSVFDWWDKVTHDGSDIARQWEGTHFNELPIGRQNHYFNIYMEELGADKYGDHELFHNSTDFQDPAMYKGSGLDGWNINEPTSNIEQSYSNSWGESKATEDVSFGDVEELNQIARIGFGTEYSSAGNGSNLLRDAFNSLGSQYNAKWRISGGVGSGIFSESGSFWVDRKYASNLVLELEALDGSAWAEDGVVDRWTPKVTGARIIGYMNDYGESKANEMEEHECDDCGFKSVDYEEYKDHRKAHDKPVGSQGESIATEEEISDGIWLVDEEEQKELDKEKKRKEQNMNIDEDYMRSMGTVSSDEIAPLAVLGGVARVGAVAGAMGGGSDTPKQDPEANADPTTQPLEESRHHEQIDVKKKWLERCEVCGDIRSSHTNGIDHKFEVDATGTEFIDPEYLEMLGESILFKKNVSVEMVRLETMREAGKWWDKTHAGTHGRKYWKDMNIRERQRTIIAYLKSVTGYGGQGVPLVEARASGVRKYALENKRIRFENPDPKFWWNDGEARTGTVLNEYKQSGLEWYSVNSGGQIYNVLKNDAELIASEHDPSEEDLGFKRCPECDILLNDYNMRIHFENVHKEFINEYLWKDDLYLVENDHRNYNAIESDDEAKALLTDLTELDLLEDLKDNEKTEQAKGEDETEDLDLIEQLMDIEEDEIKEKIEEATPNSLIRYANPKKLPNGKTIMDRIRTSHPQVNEHHLHNPLHISQYHQGDFSVTQICTECGQVIRGDPHSVDEESMQHVKETGHSTFKVEVEEAIDVLANVPFTELAELTWTSLSPVLKEKIKQKLSKEYWDDGKPTTTGEWWDMNDYGFKWSVLKGFGSFAKSDELAKAYWRHLPDHVQNVVKRYRQIHFPDALGIEGMSTNKNHNIDTYLEIAFQDFMKGNHSPNNRYEDTAYNKPNWDLGTVGNVDFGEAKANEDSLLKVEEEPEGVDVTVLDEWENKKADENDLEGLIDMYSDTTSIPRNPTYPSEPLGSGANTEECPFCGKLFDEFNLDHHVEEEHGVHTPSQYTQSTIMDNLNDEWLGEAWDKMSAKERRKLLGETKVECSRCGQPFEEDDKEKQDIHAKNRHSEQGQASDNLDIGKVEWVPLGTYKPLYESKAREADEEWDETPVQCPNCRGEGHFYHEDEDWQEMCTVCEGLGHIDRSFFQQGTNEEYYGGKIHTTHDWRGQPEILWESKATEGGFGSGKKGHSAWMKDIEWGGNYKQCPICGINTNFTGGKCEICGNSFA